MNVAIEYLILLIYKFKYTQLQCKYYSLKFPDILSMKKFTFKMAAQLRLGLCSAATCRSLLPSSVLAFLKPLQSLLLFPKNRERVKIQNGDHSSVLRKNAVATTFCKWMLSSSFLDFLNLLIQMHILQENTKMQNLQFDYLSNLSYSKWRLD